MAINSVLLSALTPKASSLRLLAAGDEGSRAVLIVEG